MKIKYELRQCLVDGDRALFHGWGFEMKFVSNGLNQPYGNHSVSIGIVEYEDGSISTVNPNRIKFIDNKHEQYIWNNTEM